MPSQAFTFDDLKHILIDRVGIPGADIPDDPQMSFVDVGLDSLALVEVHLAIEQDYGLVIPDQDASTLGTLGDAVEYVNRRLTNVEVMRGAAD
jgi:acyl carrier protein